MNREHTQFENLVNGKLTIEHVGAILSWTIEAAVERETAETIFDFIGGSLHPVAGIEAYLDSLEWCEGNITSFLGSLTRLDNAAQTFDQYDVDVDRYVRYFEKIGGFSDDEEVLGWAVFEEGDIEGDVQHDRIDAEVILHERAFVWAQEFWNLGADFVNVNKGGTEEAPWVKVSTSEGEVFLQVGRAELV